ncbi:hypothetical protein FS837_006316 [Tulasnella sp. UAMH 9824]|nr:hypothetical protein FS837_006316 [Tulasnella sp. UAMH 9824]
MRVLSRVCRLWHSVALELRFCKIRVGSNKDVDTVVNSILASNQYKDKGTVAIREITVKMSSEWYICDVSELLRLSRLSLQNFYLADVTRGSPAKCPVFRDTSVVQGNFYFPQLENLMLTGLTSVELISFLNYVNPAKLSSLFLCNIKIAEFDADNDTREKIESLQFPHLRELESMVDMSTLSLFCQAAPNLETLYVHIMARAALGELVNLLASDRLSKSFEMLKVDFVLGSWENASDASVEINALLDLIRERDWEKRIHLHNTRESWIYT